MTEAHFTLEHQSSGFPRRPERYVTLTGSDADVLEAVALLVYARDSIRSKLKPKLWVRALASELEAMQEHELESRGAP